jgi:hypothetical protein
MLHKSWLGRWKKELEQIASQPHEIFLIALGIVLAILLSTAIVWMAVWLLK